MAFVPIPLPVSKTTISTVNWGIPVTQAVNALGAASDPSGVVRSGAQASFPANAYTKVTWSTNTDNGGYVTDSSTITIPTGKDGVYAITFYLTASVQALNSYATINAGGSRYDVATSGSGNFAATVTRKLVAGDVINTYLWIPSGSAVGSTGSRLDVWKVT